MKKIELNENILTKKLLTTLLCWTLLFPGFCLSEDNLTTFNIKELALPSEVKGLPKQTGAIYYSPTIKDKVLIPVNFWGEIQNAGLHFIPVDTDLIKAISIAGGPKSSAVLEDIKLIRREGKDITTKEFNLSKGGNSAAYNETLRPGDSIFIKKDDFFQQRTYYTSLFGVIATILSSVLLYRQVGKN